VKSRCSSTPCRSPPAPRAPRRAGEGGPPRSHRRRGRVGTARRWAHGDARRGRRSGRPRVSSSTSSSWSRPSASGGLPGSDVLVALTSRLKEERCHAAVEVTVERAAGQLRCPSGAGPSGLGPGAIDDRAGTVGRHLGDADSRRSRACRSPSSCSSGTSLGSVGQHRDGRRPRSRAPVAVQQVAERRGPGAAGERAGVDDAAVLGARQRHVGSRRPSSHSLAAARPRGGRLRGRLRARSRSSASAPSTGSWKRSVRARRAERAALPQPGAPHDRVLQALRAVDREHLHGVRVALEPELHPRGVSAVRRGAARAATRSARSGPSRRAGLRDVEQLDEVPHVGEDRFPGDPRAAGTRSVSASICAARPRCRRGARRRPRSRGAAATASAPPASRSASSVAVTRRSGVASAARASRSAPTRTNASSTRWTAWPRGREHAVLRCPRPAGTPASRRARCTMVRLPVGARRARPRRRAPPAVAGTVEGGAAVEQLDDLRGDVTGQPAGRPTRLGDGLLFGGPRPVGVGGDHRRGTWRSSRVGGARRGTADGGSLVVVRRPPRGRCPGSRRRSGARPGRPNSRWSASR
jgi:hypothetical protein